MKHYSPSSSGHNSPTFLFNIKEGLKIILKFFGIITWLVVFVLTLLEVKQYYNIDVIPGVDTQVEEFYSMVFGRAY